MVIKDTIGKDSLKSKLKIAFDKFEISLNGHKALPLHGLRKQSFEDFMSAGFPTTRNEEWKYTSLEPFLKYDYKIPNAFDAVTIPEIDWKGFAVEGLTCHTIILVNGQYISGLSEIIPGDDGLEVHDLSELISNNSPLIGKYFNRLAGTSKESVTKLNTGFAQDGVFILVKKNAVLKHPIHVISITDRTNEESFISYRNIIVAEENSEAKVFHSQHSVGSKAAMVNAVEEIFAERGARLDYIKLQDTASGDRLGFGLGADRLGFENRAGLGAGPVSLIDNVFIENTTNGLVNTYTVSLSGDFIRNNLSILLSSSNSETHLYGLYLPKGNDVVDNHTFVDHAVANCFSNELYKGIMNGKSKAVFNGKILVRQDAQKTNAFQSNKNILLSPEAQVNTKPQLEIFADDVKCSHGATTGQLDEHALFYLEARGIGGDKAMQMLTLAFAEDVVEKIKDEHIHEHIDRIISRQIGFDY